MVSELKKLIKDTTQKGGVYVAKDVRNWIAFGCGVLLCFVVSLKYEHVHNELALQAAIALLGYSLGVTGIKAYAEYKNNAVGAASSDDDTSTGADDADDMKPTGKADI